MYRKNVSAVVDFAMVTTAGAADAAATVNAKRILGATLSSVVGNIINQSGGAYSLVMDSSDCNANSCGFYFTATGDVPLMITFPTTAADPTNAASFGITNLDSTISSRMGANPLINNLGNLDSAVSSRMGATPLINNLSRLDSTISSRMGTFTIPINFAALGIAATGNISNVNNVVALAAAAIDVGAITAAAQNALADSLLDRADAVEVGITPRLALRYNSSALAGVLSGAATTTVTILGVNVGDTRITATVDASGNRSVIVLS